MVWWKDAVADSAWGKVKKIDKPHDILSVGWVVVDNKDQITLAGSVGYNPAGKKEEVNNTITIPKGMVVKRKVVR